MSLVLTAYHNNGVLRPQQDHPLGLAQRQARPRQQVPIARNVIIDSSPGFLRKMAVMFLPILRWRAGIDLKE